MRAPRPIEIVEGVASADCLSVLVSESGTGKTFVLLDVSAAVSSDVAWHGRAVESGSVAYLSYEGDALGLRLRALQQTGRRLDHVYILRAHDPLSPRVTRDGEERSIGELEVSAALDTLAAELLAPKRPPIRLLIVDTVRASLAGSEDSSEHVSAYLRAVRRLMTHVPGAAAILAHHAGWQDGETKRKRERGSSAWRGNCDVTLYLDAGETHADRGETELTLRALKVRDAERPAPLYLIRRRIELPEMAGADIRRGPVTSCVIERDRRTREDREAEEAQARDAEYLATDLQVLRLLAAQPNLATAQNRLRMALGLKRDLVYAAIARLIERGWVLPPERQRQPYVVTPDGLTALGTQSI
jgi:RecA-family ATPase